MNNLTLKKIDQTNFIDAFHLELQDRQEKFVSHPIRSLAQAYVYYSQCTPFGIYFENKMVGYVMVIYDYDLSEYNIWHMIIDKHEQGKGYGKAGHYKNQRQRQGGCPEKSFHSVHSPFYLMFKV